jgi:hypothetical protein
MSREACSSSAFFCRFLCFAVSSFSFSFLPLVEPLDLAPLLFLAAILFLRFARFSFASFSACCWTNLSRACAAASFSASSSESSISITEAKQRWKRWQGGG